MEAERARRFSFAAKAGSTPLRIARSEGVWLYTDEGQQILDAAGGAIVVNIGHGRREVAEAYAREAERAAYVIPPFATESRVRLVERLVESLAAARAHARRLHERRLGVGRRGAAHRARALRRRRASRSAGR